MHVRGEIKNEITLNFVRTILRSDLKSYKLRCVCSIGSINTFEKKCRFMFHARESYNANIYM